MSRARREAPARVDERVAKGKEWPKTARALSATVNRVSSALRPAGIKIEREKLGGGKRNMLISVLPESACKFAPVAPNPLKRRGDGGRKRKALTLQRAQICACFRGTARKDAPKRPRCHPNRTARRPWARRAGRRMPTGRREMAGRQRRRRHRSRPAPGEGRADPDGYGAFTGAANADTTRPHFPRVHLRPAWWPDCGRRRPARMRLRPAAP